MVLYNIVKLTDVIIFLSSTEFLQKSTEFSVLMLKEMSVNLTENDLVIFCQQIFILNSQFIYGIILYSVG